MVSELTEREERDFKSDFLEKKKRVLRKAVEDCAREMRLPYQVYISVTESPCLQSSGNEAAHIHVEEWTICIWKRRLEQMDFDRIREVAAHEVAHLHSAQHDAKHADMEANLRVKTWRPPPGVLWFTGKNKKDLSKKAVILPTKSEILGKVTVKLLRHMARDKGLSGYSKLKKAELIELLQENLSRGEVREEVSRYTCSYHLCGRMNIELQECEYCGKTFCPEHVNHVKPMSFPPTSETRPEWDEVGHPCPDYLEHVKEGKAVSIWKKTLDKFSARPPAPVTPGEKSKAKGKKESPSKAFWILLAGFLITLILIMLFH